MEAIENDPDTQIDPDVLYGFTRDDKVTFTV